ncbi:SRPBCC family protein [Methylophaga sulfidovorans]|uniref:MxaD protein n=1 Tax=Methylophaga sulfidovorans TaxID=45496 RepID=A0A1I3Z1L9_9GAMM|nr:SRPBCC family protein [Methylophaga sulfidovorans]SFK37998.1 mxaD protein [Methylophaga sulfidovorans]
MTTRTVLKTALTTALMLTSLSTFAAGNLSVDEQVSVNASPATVWKMVGNFNGLDVWHPVVVGSDLKSGNNNEVDAERILSLGNGGTILEQLTAYSDSDNSYSYAILESPLPVKNYESTISVSDDGKGKSIVSWSSTFDAADGVDDQAAIDAITGVYNAGLNQLQKDFAQ